MIYQRKLSFLLFEYGGLITIIYLLIKMRRVGNFDAIDIKQFRISLYLLVAFIFFASAAFHDIYAALYGLDSVQLINNVAVGALFISFLLQLKKSIKK
jgi:hypothetical protein